MAEDLTIAFVGAGNMAGALIRGLIGTKTIPSTHIIAADPDQARLDRLESDLAIRVTKSNEAAVEKANVVVLATKPQVFGQVLPSLAASLKPETLVISIAAGISTRIIERMLSDGTHVVRTMPNTPALVGAGATAVAAGTHATDEDLALAQRLFESVGVVVRVPEPQIDAVTGVSGSGPAYVFAMIEALRDAGAREGLPEATALELASQTVFGTARLLLERGEAPEALRQQVTSPGGTTVAGLQALDAKGFRDAVLGAVRAATRRSTELGKIAEDVND
ncbi:MAG: pyrroline-5-carboxylate reductase [Myxococcales bacterium]|nr:pyrroline-5-carboxylate reductase [Myxococcales bacterium]